MTQKWGVMYYQICTTKCEQTLTFINQRQNGQNNQISNWNKATKRFPLTTPQLLTATSQNIPLSNVSSFQRIPRRQWLACSLCTLYGSVPLFHCCTHIVCSHRGNLCFHAQGIGRLGPEVTWFLLVLLWSYHGTSW